MDAITAIIRSAVEQAEASARADTDGDALGYLMTRAEGLTTRYKFVLDFDALDDPDVKLA